MKWVSLAGWVRIDSAFLEDAPGLAAYIECIEAEEEDDE